MMGSDPHMFDSCYSNTTRIFTQPVMLVILIVSGVHVHKTVVNTESGTGSCIKGVEVLHNWVITTGTKHDDPAVGSFQAMIRD